MTKVLITGGSGLIGQKLSQTLLEEGHEVRALSRKPSTRGAIRTFQWDPEQRTLDEQALEGVEVIIHLSGTPINASKWTDEVKKDIIDSRVESARFLLETCQKKKIRLKQYIGASAIGWYPLVISDQYFDEDQPAGKGFLAEVCQKWEDSAHAFQPIADKVTIMRIGLVLTREGGVLKEVEFPIRNYFGAPLGSGQQAMPWIHVDDISRMFAHVIEHDLEGVYNAVGPENITNAEFMQVAADVLEKPLILPKIPTFLIRHLFGEKADMVLKGAPISSKKICNTGFHFDFPTLSSALFNLYLSRTK